MLVLRAREAAGLAADFVAPGFAAAERVERAVVVRVALAAGLAVALAAGLAVDLAAGLAVDFAAGLALDFAAVFALAVVDFAALLAFAAVDLAAVFALAAVDLAAVVAFAVVDFAAVLRLFVAAGFAAVLRLFVAVGFAVARFAVVVDLLVLRDDADVVLLVAGFFAGGKTISSPLNGGCNLPVWTVGRQSLAAQHASRIEHGMVFRQITHDDLGCASYLVGDEDAGVAAVVDPRLDIDEYLRLARYVGVAIEHILETHNHADHVSGHGRLAAATGATIHIHRDAAPGYEHEPFDDGWELALGAVRVRALHTPGHRPEHTAFALFDTERGDEPWAVLTGDTLFVGDVARPDLAVDKEDGARHIFRSLHERLLSLPDDVEVWPGHLGGSLCGGPGMDMKVASTIGFERAHNELLRVTDEREFVDRATRALPPQPPNFQAIVAINRGPLVRDTIDSHPLTPRQVELAQREGALVVDVRTDQQFDDAHIPGAVCITALRAGFGSRLAWIARRDQPVVVVGRDDADAGRAVQLAAAVGITNVAGVLAGGMTSWREERRAVDRIARMTVPELYERWAEDAVQVLDVRERAEWDSGHIPGSVFTPYHDVDRVPDGIDASRPVAAICGSGQRSAVAASLLQRHGVPDVIHVVDGGVPHWRRAGWPIEA